MSNVSNVYSSVTDGKSSGCKTKVSTYGQDSKHTGDTKHNRGDRKSDKQGKDRRDTVTDTQVKTPDTPDPHTDMEHRATEQTPYNTQTLHSDKEQELHVPCVDKGIRDVNIRDSTVYVTINGSKIPALIDTGAIQASCLAHSVYKRLKLDRVCELKPSSISSVRGVGGARVPVLGEAEVPLQIGSLTTTHNFYVLQAMSHQVILGMDFLLEHVPQIDLENHRLVLKTNSQQVNFFQVSQCHVAQLDNFVSIPPQTEVVVPISVRYYTGQDVSQVVVTPVPTLASKYGIAGACVLTDVKQGKSVFRMLNPSHQEVKLVKGHPVATVCTLEDDMIGTTDTSNNVDIHVEVNKAELDQSPLQSEDDYIQVAKELGFTLEDADISEEEKRQLLVLLGKNRDVFAKDLSELGNAQVAPHKIDTSDAPPVKLAPYRVSPDKKEEIDRQIQEMIDADIVTPSVSEWQAPVVLVRKKDGKQWRFAVDYRKLNQVTRPVTHPLPRIEEVFDAIGKAKATVFSSLDLASGFWQLPLHPDSADKTGFVTHGGVYHFKKLPFGLRNSPSAFAMVMSDVLRNLTYKYAMIYVDDILVYSKSFTQHLKHLSSIFSRLRETGLKLKPSKCKFLCPKVEYLGHMISGKGVEMERAKTQAVADFPRPHNKKALRGFLGLCNYYRKFVKSFCHITRPLNQLLGNEAAFNWDEECETAFQKLKKAMTSEPILLTFPDFDKEFILSTDASDTAVGFVLGQKDDEGKEHAIAYAGKSLAKHQRNWPIRDKELFAVIQGIEHFKVYLTTEKPFTVYTDHHSLQDWKKLKPQSDRLTRWIEVLQTYSPNIVYRKGKHNGNADALSRIEHTTTAQDSLKQENGWVNTAVPDSDASPEDSDLEDRGELVICHLVCPEPPVNAIAVEQLSPEDRQKIGDDLESQDTLVQIQQLSAMTTENIAELQEKDPEAGPIIRYLRDNKLPADTEEKRNVIVISDYYTLDHKGKILYHCPGRKKNSKKTSDVPPQLVVPKVLRDDLLRSYHDSLAGGGHQGANRVYQALRLKYFWKSMMKDVNCYVGSCLTCQQANRYYGAKPAPLHPIPPTTIFSRMHVDILGPLPASKEGYKFILLFVDSFSKWCEAFPMKSANSTTVAKHLYEDIICRYGAPDSLVSDRGQQFMSRLVTAVSNMFEITRYHTSSYHPQSNAACERMNSTIEKTLRAYIENDQTTWPEILPSVMMAYRMSPCTESTQFSPYYMLFGKECRRPIDVALVPPTNMGRDAVDYVINMQQRRQVTLDVAKENILKKQEKQKQHHDKKAKNPTYTQGQQVWLYCAKTPVGQCPKLIRRWTGPYYVAQVMDKSTYRLHRQDNHRAVRSLIHANRLKPYQDPRNRPTNPPVEIEDPDEDLNPEELEQETEAPHEDHPSQNTEANTGTANTQTTLDEEQQVQDTQDQPAQETEVQAGSQQQVKQLPEIEKIFTRTKVNGIAWYKVKYAD